MIRRFFAGSILGLGILGLGCSDDPASNGGTGGAANTGGGLGTGGVTNTGGLPGVGGEVGSGGVPGTGGAGAAPGTGGSGPATGGGGGVPGTGGVSGDGGTPGGGGGSGGEVTTDGDPIPKPSLITSAAGAFWKTDVEPTMGGTTATITVNPDMELQDWIGWGGTFNEVGWNELMKLDAAERDAVMKLLFSRVDGLALTWGRIPIGASDYAIERYSLCDAPCNADNIEETFSIEHDKDPQRGLIPYIKAAQAVVEAEKATYKGIRDITFWGSPWSPPPWMKTNNAFDKGMMKNDTPTRKALAKYFRLFVEGYEAEGIPIDFVSPQNEPGWAQGYPSCAWGPFTDGQTVDTSTPAFLGSFVTEDLIPELAGKADVWFGTLSNTAHFDAYYQSLADKSAVKGVGLQWETEDDVSTPLGDNMTVMQTEHRCGNYPWVGAASSAEDATIDTFWAEYAPNNYHYAVESWDHFKRWIEKGVHSYVAWNMVLDRVGRNLDLERPWPQNALISFNQDGSTNVTPYYYVFRHVTQYAEPGGKRIGVTGGNALAFKNPDGSIVVAMYNSGGAAETTLSIGGTMLQFTVPGNGWATVNYTP